MSCGIVTFHLTSSVLPGLYAAVGCFTVFASPPLGVPPQPSFAMRRASPNGCSFTPWSAGSKPCPAPSRAGGSVRTPWASTLATRASSLRTARIAAVPP